MVRLLGLEALLMVLAGFYAVFVPPALLGYPPDGVLFVVGFLMALTFSGLYALANLVGHKMPAAARAAIGIAALGLAFVADGSALAVPPLCGVALGLLGALRSEAGRRWEGALWAVYAFAVPMLGIRYALVPLAGTSSIVQVIAEQAGTLYLLLRGLMRIFMPTSAEGNSEAGPLLHQPVPDRIVGLVEGTARASARPYATRADGSLDESAISILCRPDELTAVAARLEAALAGHPYSLQVGETVGARVELVIRPH